MCCNLSASVFSVTDLLLSFSKINGFKMCTFTCVHYNIKYHYYVH